MTDEIHEGTGTLRESVHLLREMLADYAELGKQIAPTNDAMQIAVETMVSVGGSLHDTMGDVTPTQRNLREASESLSNSANQLAMFVSKLGPAISQLGEFNNIFLRMKDTVGAIQNFSKLDMDIEQLADALAQAATVADAISELPERIHDILAELVAGQNGEQPRGPIMSWLRGRPENSVSDKRTIH